MSEGCDIQCYCPNCGRTFDRVGMEKRLEELEADLREYKTLADDLQQHLTGAKEASLESYRLYRQEEDQVSDLQKELAEANRRIAELEAGLDEFCDVYGATHEDDCPEDDTCECSGKPFNDRINALFQGNSPYTKRIAELEAELKQQSIFTTKFGDKLRELGTDERFVESYTEMKMRVRELEAENARLREGK